MARSGEVSLRRSVWFGWFGRIVHLNLSELAVDELPPLPQELDPLQCAQEFAESQADDDHSWLSVEPGGFGSIKPLLRAIFRCHWGSLLKISLLRALSCLLSFLSPLVMGRLVSYFEDSGEGLQRGLGLALLLGALLVVGAILNVNTSSRALDLKLKLQAALSYHVYFRSMSLPLVAWQDLHFSEAQVGNLLQVDVDQASSCLQNLNDLWLLPLQVAIAFALLFFQIRIAFLAGVAVIVVMVPINAYIAKEIGASTQALLRAKDLRMKVLVQALRSATSMKFCGLEKFVFDSSNRHRADEVAGLARRKRLDAACVFLWAFTPVLVPFCALSAARLLGVELTTAKVILALALLNTLIHPMNAFPWVVNGLLEARVSLQRLALLLNGSCDRALSLSSGFERRRATRDCLLTADLTQPPTYIIPPYLHRWARGGERESAVTSPLTTERPVPTGVSLNAALTLRGGTLVGLAGMTGCGKTSLLLGMLQELHGYVSTGTAGATEGGLLSRASSTQSFSSQTSQPAIQLLTPSQAQRRRGLFVDPETLYVHNYVPFSSGAAAYCPQSPQLMSGTVRSNILMGAGLDEARYRLCLHGCGLDRDLAQWPARDFREVGPSAAQLSTGQLLRIAVCRALYSRATVVLLDDPFAALDRETAQQLMNFLENYVVQTEKRCVVVSTHQVRLLRSAAEIVVLRDGAEADRGGFDALVRCAEFQALLAEDQTRLYARAQDQGGDSSSSSREEEPAATDLVQAPCDGECDGEGVGEGDEEEAGPHRRGALAAGVLRRYLEAMGVPAFALLLASLACMQVTAVLAQYYYTQRAPASRSTAADFAATAAVIVAANCLCAGLRAWLFAMCGLRACRRLYDALAAAVLGADLAVLERLPLGQINNRVGRDTNVVDDSLPFILNILLAQGVTLAGAVLVMLVSAPVALPLLLAVGALYRRLQARYRRVSRELRRLDACARSPVYTFFLDSVRCLVPLRLAPESTQSFLTSALCNKLGVSLRASMGLQCAGQFLNVRMQLLSAALTCGLALALVCGRQFSVVSQSSGGAGLALLYAGNVMGALSGFINAFVETEQELVSVERVIDYCSLEADPSMTPLHQGRGPGSQAVVARGGGGGYERVAAGEDEDEDEDEDERSPLAEPLVQGAVDSGMPDPARLRHRLLGACEGVRLQGVHLRYHGATDDVLCGVDLHLQPGHRVALVGRTGCGKTSLLRCLLRLSACSAGRVLLGGQPLESLHDLRESVCVVPQRALLFEGTVCDNVCEPRGLARRDVRAFLCDSPRMLALLLAHFDAANVGAGAGGDPVDRLLDAPVAALSAGQAQLVSVLRALALGGDLLVLDEISAALDALTAACVYGAVLEYCERRPGAVVLMVCHRLEDVHSLCNKVLRLEEGHVAAFEDLDDNLETL